MGRRGIASTDIEAEITEDEFNRLRHEANAFDEISSRKIKNGDVMPPPSS